MIVSITCYTSGLARQYVQRMHLALGGKTSVFYNVQHYLDWQGVAGGTSYVVLHRATNCIN